MSVYLGFDASTQSLTATLIEVDEDFRVIHLETSMVYDAELPSYGTDHGVLRGADPALVAAPPLMWVDALDRMMARLVELQPKVMSKLSAISGSAQQHGSVYLNDRWPSALAGARSAAQLATELADAFSRPLAPVWMDSSTSRECAEIESAVGGESVLARNTGSRAFERFTGPQIRSFAKKHPEAYARTARIHLVSSFHASLLAGEDAPIDVGDGSGMNLMDLDTRSWWPPALDATAPDLARRLPVVRPSWTSAGTLAPYWRTRYGLPAARVIVWSGDNPCSLIGTGLVREGQLGISLGTERHRVRHDADASHPRSRHRLRLGGADWRLHGHDGVQERIARARARARPVRHELGGILRGVAKHAAWQPRRDDAAVVRSRNHTARADAWRSACALDPMTRPANVRAIIEAQMMAMANHTTWMVSGSKEIRAMGGASGNRMCCR
jgi:xylulokinase